MRRRSFISLVGGAAAWPLAARAQEAGRTYRVGVLVPVGESDVAYQGFVASFRDALAKLGWVEGRHLRIDYRWTGGDSGKLPAYAAELVALRPDAVLVITSWAASAVQRATSAVPIVFAMVPDPIAAGLVGSLARPGGNVTGFALYEQAIGAKRLELLKQIAPGVSRVVFIYDPGSPVWAEFWAQTAAAAPAIGVTVSAVPVHSATEIEAAIDVFAREPNGGLLPYPSPLVVANRERIIALAARHQLPAVYPLRYFVVEGGLASYGVDNVELLRGAASYVDRILRSEKPGDLPVQFATKYELVINLKTAKVLGLDPPISLLARTDEVIE
jgi:putative tryptophan/tyrosine transport system substrate-binding protein